MIEEYQNAFANIVEARHAFAFWKGRVALYAILKALGVGPGDEVIVPGFTCVVVANSVAFAGATPIFADIDPANYNVDPNSVKQVLTSRTKALLVQHTFGLPADIDALQDIAADRGVAIVEDCAHALSTKHRGRNVGTFGLASFYSSQWSKPYTTGLGGMAVTSDEQMSSRLKQQQQEFVSPPLASVSRLRAQHLVYSKLFKPKTYWLAVNTLRRLSKLHLFVGSSGTEELNSEMPPDAGWRMSEFQANLGLKRLSTLHKNLAHRRQIGQFYFDLLRERGWELPALLDRKEITLVRFPIRVMNKWEILERAEEERIELGSWFESVIHPIRSSLEKFGYRNGSCPVAERVANEVINLPLHEGVSTDEATRIVDFICRTGKTALQTAA